MVIHGDTCGLVLETIRKASDMSDMSACYEKDPDLQASFGKPTAALHRAILNKPIEMARFGGQLVSFGSAIGGRKNGLPTTEVAYNLHVSFYIVQSFVIIYVDVRKLFFRVHICVMILLMQKPQG